MIIPAENEKDLQDVPAPVLKAIQVETVEHVDEVLRKALALSDPDRFLLTQEPTVEQPVFPPETEVSPSSEVVTH